MSKTPKSQIKKLRPCRRGPGGLFACRRRDCNRCAAKLKLDDENMQACLDKMVPGQVNLT